MTHEVDAQPNEHLAPDQTLAESEEEARREDARQARPDTPSPESGDAHDDENPSG